MGIPLYVEFVSNFFVIQPERSGERTYEMLSYSVLLGMKVYLIFFLLGTLHILHLPTLHLLLMTFICVVDFVAGYGFVDFETPASAESAVKALQAKGVQAQMAKVGISLLRRLPSVRCMMRNTACRRESTKLYVFTP
jgi:hypothetical protein